MVIQTIVKASCTERTRSAGTLLLPYLLGRLRSYRNREKFSHCPLASFDLVGIGVGTECAAPSHP